VQSLRAAFSFISRMVSIFFFILLPSGSLIDRPMPWHILCDAEICGWKVASLSSTCRRRSSSLICASFSFKARTWASRYKRSPGGPSESPRRQEVARALPGDICTEVLQVSSSMSRSTCCRSLSNFILRCVACWWRRSKQSSWFPRGVAAEPLTAGREGADGVRPAPASLKPPGAPGVRGGRAVRAPAPVLACLGVALEEAAPPTLTTAPTPYPCFASERRRGEGAATLAPKPAWPFGVLGRAVCGTLLARRTGVAGPVE